MGSIDTKPGSEVKPLPAPPPIAGQEVNDGDSSVSNEVSDTITHESSSSSVPVPPLMQFTAGATSESISSKLNRGFKEIWESFNVKQKITAASTGAAIVAATAALFMASSERTTNDSLERDSGNPGKGFDNGTEMVPAEDPAITYEHVDGTIIETTTYPDGWVGGLQKRTRVYKSPYTYTEESFFADGTTTADSRESSYEPLADVGLDHPIYEAVTGTSWEEFVETAKSMTPEISGEAYDAEDVVEGYYIRSAVTVTSLDPRFIEITFPANSLDYRLTHTAVKEALAGERSLAIPNHTVSLERLSRKKSENGEVFVNTTDLNVSMSTEFTAEYLLSSTYTDGDNPPEAYGPRPMKDTFVLTDTMLGNIFLIEQ